MSPDMEKLIEAARQALQALESWMRLAPDLALPEYAEAITALRQALEQPKQEPLRDPLTDEQAQETELKQLRERVQELEERCDELAADKGTYFRLYEALCIKAESDKKANKNVVDDVAGLQKTEPAAKVQVKTTGGNAGLATQIVEIDDPLRERLQPGQLLYTEPPKREWFGLTREEKAHILDHCTTVASAVKAIEAKLKEKNA